MVLILPLTLLALLAWRGESLSAQSKQEGSTAQDLFSRITKGPKTKATKDPEAVLRELNLQSSTEPRLAGADFAQIPILLSASVTPILRAASGVFSSNYELGLEPKDEARYSFLRVGNAQLLETGFYKPPKEPLEIYEYESDASCRLVREACSMLSLTVTVYPTPKNGPHYRLDVSERFQNLEKGDQFPYLFDPNTKVKISTAADIIEYLFQNYGPGKVPGSLDTEKSSWPKISASFGLQVARLGAGGTYRDCSFQTEEDCSQPLVLYMYEGSPFAKIVRESLSELEIPHTIVYCPRGSRNRQRLYEKTGGRFQVPYLEDPNTGVAMFESQAIVEYLEKRYALTTPVRYL